MSPVDGELQPVSVEADTFQITVEPGIVVTAARRTSRAILRQKASRYDNCP